MKKLRSLAAHQRHWYARWHTLAGLLAGGILLVVSLTGALLVFEAELDVWLYPELFTFEEAAGPPLALETVHDRAAAAYPDYRLRSVYRRDDLNGAFVAYVAQEPYPQLIVDPYTGRVTGERVYSESIMGFIRNLHRTLLVPTVGKYLVGVASLICAMLMITGLRQWLPKRWRNLRARLGVKWSGGAKRVTYDLHNTVGFYFSPIITLVSLTGVMITFSQVILLFLFLLSFESPTSLDKILDQRSEYVAGAEPLSIGAAAAYAERALPGFEVLGVSPPRDSAGAYEFSMLGPNGLATGDHGIAFIDQYSGATIGTSEAAEYRLIKVYLNYVTPVHYGTFGGIVTRLLALLASLVTAGLFVSGLLIWWRRGKTKKPRRVKRSASRPQTVEV